MLLGKSSQERCSDYFFAQQTNVELLSCTNLHINPMIQTENAFSEVAILSSWFYKKIESPLNQTYLS